MGVAIWDVGSNPRTKTQVFQLKKRGPYYHSIYKNNLPEPEKEELEKVSTPPRVSITASVTTALTYSGTWARKPCA